MKNYIVAVLAALFMVGSAVANEPTTTESGKPAVVKKAKKAKGKKKAKKEKAADEAAADGEKKADEAPKAEENKDSH